MISVYISIVFFCLQWLYKSYISKLVFTDFSITLPITLPITSPIISPCPTRVIAVGTKFCSVLSTAVSVRGLIPDLERSDGSSPQASCHLSLVFPSFIVSQAPSSR